MGETDQIVESSEFELLAAMTRSQLEIRLKRSLSGFGDLPSIFVSAGESPADVWASFFEQSEPDSPFRIRMIQIMPCLLDELLREDELPDWSEDFCRLLRRVRSPQCNDLLRTFVLNEKFRQEIYRLNDLDRALLHAAVPGMRADTDFWQKLLRDERYCDIAHLALSTSVTEAIKHLNQAVSSAKGNRRKRPLVWGTLDRWLGETGNAELLAAHVNLYISWNSAIRPFVEQWAEKRDIGGFRLAEPIKVIVASRAAKAGEQEVYRLPKEAAILGMGDKQSDEFTLQLYVGDSWESKRPAKLANIQSEGVAGHVLEVYRCVNLPTIDTEIDLGRYSSSIATGLMHIDET